MKVQILKQPVMFRVLYALIPITLYSVFLFGWRVLAVVITTNLAAFLSEYVFVRNKPNGKVTSAVFVTGTLLGLILPPTIPLWMAAVGGIVAIVFGKMIFGGFGMNLFNPAIVGRTFLYVTFANYMTVRWVTPFTSLPGGFAAYSNLDNITSATPLVTDKVFSLPQIFTGMIPGSIGETSALLIILAGIYLLLTKTAKWQAMLSTFLSFLLFTIIFNFGVNPLQYLFSGGILFGTVFMVTDPVSMPKNKYAIWIFGLLIGFLTVFIRKFSLWSEGFMFALLLANSFMPIIEYGLTSKKAPVKEKG
ncbi:MAG: RnfABCDGE type electron transport complex subunit D [Candidatus Cloacimonetes bacterium]|nr:RnfABCDGE type electron transport complex subunit D [Candidatus Cloacimonadota bacterium]